jgi:hypothetical protein
MLPRNRDYGSGFMDRYVDPEINLAVRRGCPVHAIGIVSLKPFRDGRLVGGGQALDLRRTA